MALLLDFKFHQTCEYIMDNLVFYRVYAIHGHLNLKRWLMPRSMFIKAASQTFSETE